jgi:hypothetical protein
MKRGQPPKRHKPLARGKPPRRSSRPIPARRADPKKRRFADRRQPDFIQWLLQEPCCITNKRTGHWNRANESFILVDPAHIKTRSTGGDDLYNAVPLAHHLHEEQHRIGIKSFQRKYGVDLVAIAKAHTERFLAEHPEHALDVQ